MPDPGPARFRVMSFSLTCVLSNCIRPASLPFSHLPFVLGVCVGLGEHWEQSPGVPALSLHSEEGIRQEMRSRSYHKAVRYDK